MNIHLHVVQRILWIWSSAALAAPAAPSDPENQKTPAALQIRKTIKAPAAPSDPERSIWRLFIQKITIPAMIAPKECRRMERKMVQYYSWIIC